jgi:cytochrome c oxidase assembly protein subunit 15
VALAYLAFCIYVIRSKALSAVAKRLAGFGLFVLLLQLVMGGLTVLKLVKEIIVTSHLMLATTFLCVVLWIGFVAVPGVSRRRVLRKLESPNAGKAEATAAPAWVKWMATAVAVAVFGQIFLGGLVASTYAGSVCVDWPLCNGQWFPTWQGAIGLQIMHRMMAYGLALVIPLVACLFHCLHRFRRQTWMTDQLLHLSYLNVAVVLMQVALGVANLLLYIPPHVTVLHQSVGLILLIVNLRVVFVTWALARSRQATLERNQEAGVSGWRSGAAL